jgi:heat shock protein HtpX
MWDLIQSNRQKSILLFIGLGAVLFFSGYIFGRYYNDEYGGPLGVMIGLSIWLILSSISYFAGTKIMLSISGAKEVTKAVHPQLFNVVEEMKIAANLPHMPKIYIIDDPAPNAFAAGIKPENSVIAVTAGLLGRLNRDELQGVVAHEMAHIINRDVLLMTFAGVTIGAITIISEVFLRSLIYGGGSRYKSKSSEKGGQIQLVIMIVALVFAILAPIMARLLYLGISRKREYLADASAVRLSRYPEGLASALEKISDSTIDLKKANSITAPMYIVNPLKPKGLRMSNLTSTHPPISERIKILRAMQNGVHYLSYQSAYQFIKNSRDKILPAGAALDAVPIALKRPPVGWYEATNEKEAKRTSGDLMMKLNDFSFIDCSCGVKIKIPPEYKHSEILCPKCRTKHLIPAPGKS